MTSMTLRTAVVEHQLSQEPCASCQVAADWRTNWPGELPEMFKCEVEETYLCCPWTGRKFPWTRMAGRVFVDYDVEVKADE